MCGGHGNHFVIKTTQKYCKNEFICKEKELKKIANHLPACLGCFHSNFLSCLVFFCPCWIFQLSKSWKFHPISQSQRECVDTKIPWRSTRGRTNVEVDEGSFPMFSKVQPNLVRVPHFLSANCTSSDLKCLFENANCNKSFARDRLSFLTSTVPEVSIFQDKVTVSS